MDTRGLWSQTQAHILVHITCAFSAKLLDFENCLHPHLCVGIKHLLRSFCEEEEEVNTMPEGHACSGLPGPAPQGHPLLGFSHFSTSAPSAHQPYPVKMAVGARVSYIENATPVALCLAPQPWPSTDPQGFQDPLDRRHQCFSLPHIYP